MDKETQELIEKLRQKIKENKLKPTELLDKIITSNDGVITSTNGITGQAPVEFPAHKKPARSTEKIDSTDTLKKIQQKAQLQGMKKDSIYYDSSIKPWRDAEELIEAMAELSFKSQQPILSTWNEKSFVIEANSTDEKACESFIEQIIKPHEKSYKALSDSLEWLETDYSDTPERRTYWHVLNAKIAETIIEQYPEKADTLDTIQLMAAYYLQLKNQKPVTASPLLKKSIDEYMSGKETFKPTIYNVAQLDNLIDIAAHMGWYTFEDLEKRTTQTEKDMLKTLEDTSLWTLDRKGVTFAEKISAKYPEDETAKKVREKSLLVLEKINKGKSQTTK